MRNYLKYVNHYRDEVFKENFLKLEKRAKNKLIPINKNDYSFFIYSNYSYCEKTNNCKTIFLQGDSVGEGLGNNASDILFSKAIQNGWQVIHGGTSSFSPKNFSGQLAYFNSKGIRPNILISYIDQGDFGDDAIRYKKHSILKKDPIKHYVVKPFTKSHFRFYNYGNSLKIINPYRLQPLAFEFTYKVYSLLALRLFNITNGKLNLTSTPGWSDIIRPLIEKDPKKEAYFKEVLNNYISTAKELGVQELYFVSMPHPRNIVDSISEDRKFKYSVASLLEDLIKLKTFDDIEVHHIPIVLDQKLFPCKGKDETCNGFFMLNDHHPDIAGYKYMGNKIIKFINENTNFKDFK